MKKFIIVVSVLVALVILYDTCHYHLGLYIDLHPDAEVTTFVKTQDTQILLDRGSGYEEFEIRGVNMGSGIPGQWSTDFSIDKETYLRWFAQIKELGANTLRIYTVQSSTFYDAFYEYNSGNPDPLYLIHGVWLNDYILNSHRDAYDTEFIDALLNDSKTVVDVLHGQKKINLGRMASAGHGTYKHDISPWVIGYILGVEWEDVTVAYTDEKYKNDNNYNSYSGKYMYTGEDATPFEALLARLGDKVIEYESSKYKTQKLLAFSNWPTTDPFDYPYNVTSFMMKFAKVDVEHIKTTDAFLSGQFASYHVYPYYPDYLAHIADWSDYNINIEDFRQDGVLNTYKAYLSMLTTHHTLPVVISEFGVSTGRGMAQVDINTGRNQGRMSETEQGYALLACYDDLRDVGCAGCCVFTWQDEWFKRTWNTMHAVNLMRTPYWSDYQTNEQYFGLLSFDPGNEQSVCYVDGDVSEWKESDLVFKENDLSLSLKYDERFIYFLAKKENFDFGREVLYLPIDVTPKSGSSYCENNGLLFDRAVDFLVTVDGADNSRVQVQERYEALRSTYSEAAYSFDTYIEKNVPDKDSPKFVNIDMILKAELFASEENLDIRAEVFETGILTHGDANPRHGDFNSLADFAVNGDYVELKLPWQLLNFADASKMTIHDDYYDGNYGIEFISIDEFYVGLSCGTDDERIPLYPQELKGWKNEVTYHERLKPSYYILQSVWGNKR
ncbi:MAG: hypothetical protein IIV78_04415 [Oscillospiraceae bacterium]|nr:hypothetical protein [Oscillospiraceae bacterium]